MTRIKLLKSAVKIELLLVMKDCLHQSFPTLVLLCHEPRLTGTSPFPHRQVGMDAKAKCLRGMFSAVLVQLVSQPLTSSVSSIQLTFADLYVWNRGSNDMWYNWATITGDDGWSWASINKYFRKVRNYRSSGSSVILIPADLTLS